MNKGQKVLLRKSIRDYDIINLLQKQLPVKLPDPPIYDKNDYYSLSWKFNLSTDKGSKKFNQILNILDLPNKSSELTKVKCKIHRLCWWNILFEVFIVEE